MLRASKEPCLLLCTPSKWNSFDCCPNRSQQSLFRLPVPIMESTRSTPFLMLFGELGRQWWNGAHYFQQDFRLSLWKVENGQTPCVFCDFWSPTQPAWMPSYTGNDTPMNAQDCSICFLSFDLRSVFETVLHTPCEAAAREY